MCFCACFPSFAHSPPEKGSPLNTKLTTYENLTGAPATRLTRKAKTADLRPRFRAVDVLLEGMDDLILQFTGTEEKDLFVDGYFNACRIGGNGSGAEEEEGGDGGGTTPPRRTRPRRTRKLSATSVSGVALQMSHPYWHGGAQTTL